MKTIFSDKELNKIDNYMEESQSVLMDGNHIAFDFIRPFWNVYNFGDNQTGIVTYRSHKYT